MSTSALNHPLLGESSLENDARTVTETSSGTGGARFTSLQVLAFALAAAGVVALAIGWFGVSDKVEVWEQLPYLISGGLGGTALIGFGITAYVAHEHAEDRRVQSSLEARIEQLESDLAATLSRRLDELEMAVAAEFDQLGQQGPSGARPRS
jgi:hypothetical protein